MTSDQPKRIVIRDVALIDATGREPEGRVDVLVEDGRIATVGAVARARLRRAPSSMVPAPRCCPASPTPTCTSR